MYGGNIVTEYAVSTSRHSSVVGPVRTSPVGNLVLDVGHWNLPDGATEEQHVQGGWSQTEWVIMPPDEAAMFCAEILDAVGLGGFREELEKHAAELKANADSEEQS